MENTLEARVCALEKDMAEVKADVASLKERPTEEPQDVDGMINGLLSAAIKEAYDKNDRR